VFLWLVPCFAIWHFISAPLAALQAYLAMVGADAWFAGLVSGWERQDAAIEFATRVQALSAGRVGDVVIPVNARIYSYGLALFAGLSLATDPRRWIGLAAGLLTLLPVAAWGVAFDLLQQVFIAHGAIAARDYLPTALERNLIAIGYQVGAIILPPAAPVVVWGVVHRAFLARWTAI